MGGASKKTKRRRSRGASSGRAASSVRSSAWRPDGRIYQLSEDVRALLAETKRLFPGIGEPVRFDAILPGCESVETVSRQLFDVLRSAFDEQRFMLFCRLNAERLQDYVQYRLEAGAWPLDREEILAEAYYRLFDDLMFRAGRLPERRTSFEWPKPRGPAGIFEMLRCAVDRIVNEQIDLLRVRTTPLPGVPGPVLAAPEPMLGDAASVLESRGCRLDRKTLTDWIAHAMTRLEDDDRRVLYLREVAEFDYARIARDIGTTPMLAGVQVREARLRLHRELLRLLELFRADQVEGLNEENLGPGRVVQGPGSHRRRAPDRERSPEGRPEGDDEVED